MNILIASAEAVPFAKVGGLADVVGTLPGALRRQGIDARVIMPGYGFIEHMKYGISHLFTFEFTHRKGTSDVHVYTCVYDGVPFYFVQVWPYFGQDGTVYTDWNWDVPRFILFNQLVPAVAWELRERIHWFPDVVHVNDWHTALVPFLMADSRWKEEWSQVATVLTIHNIAYQGDHVGGFLWDTGIPGRHHGTLAYHGLSDNLLGIGCAYSDMINTVSPRYATEITYPYAGFELAGMIRDRSVDLMGILNGLDTDYWNPETDPHIVNNFNIDTVETQRIANKHHLQSYARLPVRDDVPVIGMVTRLAKQKGLDMALPAMWQLLSEEDVQFVILGTGEPDLEHQAWLLSRHFPWKSQAFLQFDAKLAQHIYAGCDIFLMPSHFEPCGMGQMIAMRYGALPLVRETGGLADTVVNYDNEDGKHGTGFVFQWQEMQAVYGTLRWAIDTYRNKPHAWKQMQRNAMQQDFGWHRSAQQYLELYQRAISKHKKEPFLS